MSRSALCGVVSGRTAGAGAKSCTRLRPGCALKLRCAEPPHAGRFCEVRLCATYEAERDAPACAAGTCCGRWACRVGHAMVRPPCGQAAAAGVSTSHACTDCWHGFALSCGKQLLALRGGAGEGGCSVSRRLSIRRVPKRYGLQRVAARTRRSVASRFWQSERLAAAAPRLSSFRSVSIFQYNLHTQPNL